MKKITYKDYTIKIETDEFPSNPRTEWDNMTVMAFFHKRYNLGDKDPGISDRDYGSWDEMEDAIRKKFDIAVISPVYMYDHSGITIATRPFSCPWDSGQIGFVWITKKSARENMLWKAITKARLKRLEEVIEAEIEAYDNYLTGEVYVVSAEDPDGNSIHCVGGYFGEDGCDEDGYAVDEAKSAIDYDIKERERLAKPKNNKDQMVLPLEGVA